MVDAEDFDPRLVDLMQLILDSTKLDKVMAAFGSYEESPEQTLARLRKLAVESLLPRELAWLEQKGITV